MPRPRSLSQAQLASAALAVIDREGLTGLTMRAVAKELGMSTMALYRYVTDRQELERLVVELVLGAVDTTPPAASSWRAQIAIMVERVRVAAGAHPAIVPLTVIHRQSAPSQLRWAETVAGILAAAGIDHERRVVALRALLSYVIGAIQLEHLGALSGAGTAAIAGLPGERFPHLSETARHAARVGPDEEFGGGLELLLSGLAAGTPEKPAQR
jgi:AcrR family transcriptional regulator